MLRVLVLLLPVIVLVFTLAWLAGRPRRRAGSAYDRSAPEFPEYDRRGRMAATDPEKDAEFLRQVRERAQAQRRLETERRRRLEREREQRGGSDPDPAD